MADQPDISLLLDGLKKHNESDLDEILLVSSRNTTKMLPMTIGQQKQLVSSLIARETSELNIDTTLGEIILENITTPQSVYSIDTPYIVLQMRANLMGGDITLTLNETDYEIDISKHIKKIYKQFNDSIDTTYDVSEGKVVIKCQTPLLSRECELNRAASKYIEEKYNTTTEAVGDIYLIEIMKQIKTICIDDNQINLEELDLETSLSLINNLPYSLTKQIVKKTEDYTNIIDTISTPPGLPEGVPMDIDGRLFTGE